MKSVAAFYIVGRALKVSYGRQRRFVTSSVSMMPLFNADEQESLARLSPLGRLQPWPPETNQTKSCNPVDDIGAMDHCPKRIGKLYLNRSHCLTSNRSVAANPSLGSCDPHLEGKPTLPSMELLTVTGTPYEIARTFDPDLWPV